MKIVTLLHIDENTALVITICVGIIIFSILVWWLTFTYCWRKEIAIYQESIAKSLDKIVKRLTGEEDKELTEEERELLEKYLGKNDQQVGKVKKKNDSTPKD